VSVVLISRLFSCATRLELCSANFKNHHIPKNTIIFIWSTAATIEAMSKSETSDQEISNTADAVNASDVLVIDAAEIQTSEEPAADTENPKEITSIEVEDNKNGKSTKIGIKDGDTDQEENRSADRGETIALVLDIVERALIFVMSILFICGTALSHPRFLGRIRNPYVFLLIGALCYIGSAGIQMHKRKSNGSAEIVACTTGILAGVFWFIGSIFTFEKTLDASAFGSLWIVGSVLNLCVITYEIIMVLKKEGGKPLFLSISLFLSCIANFMFVVGASLILENDTTSSFCGAYHFSNSLISGAVMYFLHSGFLPLALYFDNYTFTVQISSNAEE